MPFGVIQHCRACDTNKTHPGGSASIQLFMMYFQALLTFTLPSVLDTCDRSPQLTDKIRLMAKSQGPWPALIKGLLTSDNQQLVHALRAWPDQQARVHRQFDSG